MQNVGPSQTPAAHPQREKERAGWSVSEPGAAT